MREVIIVSTRNTQVARFQVANDINYGQLKEVVGSSSYDWADLIAVENINKTALMSDNSMIPNGDVKIFLRPAKTKSGNVNIRALFKDSKELQDLAKSKTGKNYTILPNVVLTEIYESSIATTTLNPSEVSALVKRIESLEKRVLALEQTPTPEYDEEDDGEDDYEDTSEYDEIMEEFDDLY